MYAIVDIAGQQFKVHKEQHIFVHRLGIKEGEEVDFENVLLIDAGGKVDIGDPLIKGAKVTAKVVRHGRSKKIKVFKMKRRKGYRRTQGHRQYFTEVLIEAINS